MMKVPSRTVAFFCMPGVGHFHAMRPVIASVAGLGLSACVFTDAAYQREVERFGGRFFDLFARHPIEEADNESRPIPCRYVSFAARFAGPVIEQVRRLNPSLIIYDTQAVIGPVVAHALELPHVCNSAGHNVNPARFLAALQHDRRVAISDRCRQAVETLRTRHGMSDASPFSYVTTLSPYLNLYGEPPQFLEVVERTAFEPLAFFGCLPDPSAPPRNAGERFFGPPTRALRLYVSFGTIVWSYFAEEALQVLQSISEACGELEHVRAVISLGGASIEAGACAALEGPNVRVMPYVDQPRILQEADLFVTHHGRNSTHEAILERVAMISCPFFWDQPALARKCQDLGLAIPLTASPLRTVTATDVKTAVSQFERNREAFRARLDLARSWELETIAQRPRVMRRILELM